MATDFTLPELGENIAGGDVVRLLVSPGDTVTKDQPILELETDKATIEVPSNVSGTVKEIKIKQGERVKVGQVVLTLEERRGAGARRKAGRKQEAKQEAEEGRQGGGQAAKRHPRPSLRESPEPAPETEEARRGRRHQSRREERTARRRHPSDAEPQGARGTGGAVRTAARARARRRDSPRCRQRSGRTHQRRRRSGVRAARRWPAAVPLRPARRRRCPTSASGARSSASR